MNIKETFLNLTTRTYPHGTEKDLFHLLPSNLQTDEFGNLYIEIGDKPSTMFTSHLDTATFQLRDVIHQEIGNIIRTDGSSILGADDKAGVTIMMYMIEKNVPGLYYFFLGEEVGCIGSRKLATKHKTEPIPYIKKVVSFDRRGYDSVITHQLGGRCCSNDFGNALSKELNTQNPKFKYSNDPTGIYTDSAQFTPIYPECTNVSVGYNYEHTCNEQQDIVHLENLCEAVIKVNWESLPVSRKFTDDEEYDEFDDYYYPSYKKTNYVNSYPSKDKETSNKSWTIEYFFEDPIFGDEQKNSITFNKYTDAMVDIKLNKDRIEYEEGLISDLLETLEVEHDEFEWNGTNLAVTYKNENYTNTKRHELTEYIPELDFWKEILGWEENNLNKIS